MAAEKSHMILKQKHTHKDHTLRRLTSKYIFKKAQREELQRMLDACSVPNWMDALVRPLTRAVQAHLGDGWEAEVCGPFGLCCHVEITLHKKGHRTEWALELEPGDLNKAELYRIRPDLPYKSEFALVPSVQ